jgi:hypothetical protein
MTDKPMTFEAWWEHFKPVKNAYREHANGPYVSDDGESNGRLFEKRSDEWEFVRSVADKEPGRVWTLIDCDGMQVVANGIHIVNSEGYFVTEVAFEGTFLDINVDDEEDLAGDDDLDDEEGFESAPASSRPKP